MLDFGILGMNARNLLYIKKFNSKKGIRLADNKYKTKNYLSNRGIPVPHTYAVIKNRNELYNINFSLLQKKEFVIKPNKGSRGRGIYIVKLQEDNQQDSHKEMGKKLLFLHRFLPSEIEKKIQHIYASMHPYYIKFFRKHISVYDHYYKTGGIIMNDTNFRRTLLDILYGKHSLTLGHDKILVEEKLIPSEGFEQFCEYGLADVRMIVFNLVPVAAMLRMPTEKSEGKANLDRGGIGLGIDINSGRITSMYYEGKIYKKSFPKKYKAFYNKKIPYWNDILFFSAKIQFFMNLGYLGLDWVITLDGPKLLEINSRSGLKIQNVLDLRLKSRLKKIVDLKIDSPEKGVEIAKTLFTSEKVDLATTNKIVYLSQYGKLQQKSEGKTRSIDVIVKTDIHKNENYISPYLHTIFYGEKATDVDLNLYDNDILFRNFKAIIDEELPDNTIILGKSNIGTYFLKPEQKIFDTIHVSGMKELSYREKNNLHLIDQKIYKLSKKIILASVLKPQNYFSELDNFIVWNGKYNPKFEYKFIEDNPLQEYTDELLLIKDDIQHFDKKISFLKLFDEKIDELLFRLHLVKAYKNKNYGDISLYNKKLFGEFDKKLLDLSKEKIFTNPYQEDDQLLGDILNEEQIKEYILAYLKEKGIEAEIIFSATNFSRVSVIMGKSIKISIQKGVMFRKKDLYSMLAHEVDTHLLRYLHGSQSGWNIFQNGTGFYQKDEEGLAIYNANKVLPQGYEKLNIYKKYFLVKESENHNFIKLIDVIKFLYPDWSMERLFKTGIRMKKGLHDTSIVEKGAYFAKDKIYLDGYQKIKKWIATGGEPEKMYQGKVKIEDLGKF